MIHLLDDMMQLGFREATHSGLSFATDDLITPATKVQHIATAEKQVLRFKKLYERGVITEKERYNQVLDTWTHAREAITGEMREAMRTDDRGNSGYVNPVYLMADSGARGGIEQIRQLAGMRGLMAKPTGEIIETPIKSNFREGLTVLEYFSSTHGARKGLTCEAPLGVCRHCYGMDLATGNTVEDGMAVGIIAAQSIGEPGTQLTMRTFHIGGTVNTSVEESETKAKKEGIVKFTRMRFVPNEEGKNVVLTRNGEISLLDTKGRELEKYDVPNGAILRVDENQTVKVGQVLCEWDPHSIPILSEVAGKVRFEDVVEGETLRLEKDPSGHM